MADGTVTIGGVLYDITITPHVPTPPPPPPGPVTVTIGGASRAVDGVNPTSSLYPGGRGPDQLILYRAPVGRTVTNAYGAEVSVLASGTIDGINDRQATGSATGTAVPPGGMVLSGHGVARTWLLADATVGAKVTVTTGTPPPPPPTTGRTLGIYVMDGVGHVSQVPDNCTQIRVAFLQDGGLVEWGGDTPAQTAAALTAWRAAKPGRQVLVSIGGAGGQVTLGQMESAVRAIEKTFPLDGIDFDVESTSLDVSAAVALAKALAAGRESSWLTTFTPSGGPPVSLYLDAAKQCQAAGLRVQVGSQLYDAEVSLAAALGVLATEIAVVGAESVVVAMMVASDAQHWTVDQCEANMRAIVQRWPTIGGAVLWESSRDGTADWASRVGAVLA